MKLSMAEVYEVASFYDHFDIVKEGENKPAPVTIRVCDSLSCMMAGAETLISELEQGVDPSKVRIMRAPCIFLLRANRQCPDHYCSIATRPPMPSLTHHIRILHRVLTRSCEESPFAGHCMIHVHVKSLPIGLAGTRRSMRRKLAKTPRVPCEP